jgi:hypothetical protein
MIRGKIRCPNCGELGHRKTSYKCPLNGAKKRQDLIYFPSLVSFIPMLLTLHLLTLHTKEAKEEYYKRVDS